MKKIIFSVICVFLMFYMIGGSVETSASPYEYENQVSSEISLDVEMGIDGVYKSGRNVPVNISIENTEGEFTGKVRIIEIIDSKDTLLYEYNVEIAENRTLEFTENIYLKSNFDIEVLVLDEDDNVICSSRIPVITEQNGSELIVGIYSDNMDAYSYMENMIIAYFNNVYFKGVSLADYTKLNSVKDIDMLDVIIINNFNTSVFSDETKKVIAQWVTEGGVIVTGTGKYGMETIAMYEGIWAVEFPGSFDVGALPIGVEEQQSVELAIYDLAVNGAKNVVMYGDEQADDYILRKYYGKGCYTFLKFDLEDEALLQILESSSTAVANLYENVIGYEKISNISNEFYNSFNNMWSITNMLSSIVIENIPNIIIYIIIIGLYIILIGPVLYITMKKQRKFYSAGVCILSIIFTVVIYIIGSSTRYNEPFINYASIISIKQDTSTEITYLNIRSPYNEAYSVGIKPECDISPQFVNVDTAGNENQYDNYSVIFRNMSEYTAVDIDNTAAFNEKYFRIINEYEKPEGNFGIVRYFGAKVTGDVHNCFETKMENAAVVMGNQLIYIGDIEAGQVVDLSEYQVYSVDYSDYYNMANFLSQMEKDKVNNVVINQRVSILEYYFEQYGNECYEDPKLISFSTDKNTMNAQTVTDYKCNGQTLYSIDIESTNESNGKEYRYNLDNYANVREGTCDLGSMVTYSKDLVILYEFEENFALDKLYVSSYERSSGYVEVFKGDVYIYNYLLNEYELIIADSIDISDHRYVDDNSVKIKFVSDDEVQSFSGAYLPNISVTGEVR